MEVNQENRTVGQRTGMIGILVLLIAALVLPVGRGMARAQEATPTPVTCDLEPVSETFLADLLELPVPEVTATAVSAIPEGTEATDDALRTDVTTVIEKLISCVNQGEVLRSFALFDPHYLRRVIDPDGLMSQAVAIEIAKSFATPEAIADDQMTRLERVLSVRQLADGAIVVIFETSGGVDRERDETQVDLFVLREIDGKWLIVDGLSDVAWDESGA